MNSKPDVNSMVESYLSEFPESVKGSVFTVYDQYGNEQGRSGDKNTLKGILIDLLNDPTRELHLNVKIEDEFRIPELSKEETNVIIERCTKFLSKFE